MAGLKQILDATRMGAGAEALQADMRKRIVGQEPAVRQIVRIYQTFLAGMTTPGRPVGSLLFLGPTGSGKTRTVEANALIRPKLGFGSGAPDARLAEKLSSAGAEAARRRFTPEFMNRIDQV